MEKEREETQGDFLVLAQAEHGVVPSGYEEQVQRLLRASVAQRTRVAYASRLRLFFRWCEKENILPVFPATPETVAAYIASLGQAKASCSTVDQSMAAIAAVHRAEGLASPTESLLVKKIVKGYRRAHGVAPRKKEAATIDVIRVLLAALRQENRPKSIRDAAIIALGFVGAFRRSELVALNLEDLKWTMRDGQEILLITVRRSKTDQEGAGTTKAIFTSKDKTISPIDLLKRWIALISQEEKKGPLFRGMRRNGYIAEQRLSEQSVALIIKKAARKAGLHMDMAGHSLRSGFVTSAIRQGKTERSIMNQTGHKSTQVLREYFQREDAIEDNAARDLI